MRLLVAVLASALTACAAIHPTKSRDMVDAPAAAVIEVRHIVPVPVDIAYRRIVSKGRECWQQSTGLILTMTTLLETDPYDKDVGYALVAVRTGKLVPTIVQLRPAADGQTAIVGRSLKMPGTMYHLGEKDLPALDKWALGQAVDCKTAFIF